MARLPVKHFGATTRGIRASLKSLPISMAHDIASQVAPDFTRRTRTAYLGGKTVYGDERPEGKHGPLTLQRTGATFRTTRFVQTGTVVRCALGPKYAKYLIGKYKILPVGDRSALPTAWSRSVDDIAARVFVAQTQRIAA
jgi:hypothetical protein